MWELDLSRLTHAAVDPRMQGVSPAGLKILGFAAALARAPSTLGLDSEATQRIASALIEAGCAIAATHGDRPV